MATPRTTLLVGLALLPVAPRAQEPARAEAPRPEVVRVQRAPGDAERPLVLEPGEYAVWDLVQRAGEHLQRSYVAGDPAVPAQAAGTIDLRFPMQVPAAEIDAFVDRLLAHVQLFQLPVHAPDDHGIHQVLSLAGPRRGDVLQGLRFVEAEELTAAASPGDLVITIVALEHADAHHTANELQNLIQRLSSNAQFPFTVWAGGDRSSVRVCGPASLVASCVELARRLDRLRAPDPESQRWLGLRVVRPDELAACAPDALVLTLLPLRHAAAQTLGDQLRQHVQILGMRVQNTSGLGTVSIAPTPHRALTIGGPAAVVTQLVDLAQAVDAQAASAEPADAALEQRVSDLEKVLAALTARIAAIDSSPPAGK